MLSAAESFWFHPLSLAVAFLPLGFKGQSSENMSSALNLLEDQLVLEKLKYAHMVTDHP